MCAAAVLIVLIITTTNTSVTTTIQQLISLALTVSIASVAADHLPTPPMLSMLLTGLLLKNALPSLIVPLPHSWTTQFWSLALTCIVAKASLSLDLPTLARKLRATLVLATVPLAVQIVVSYFLTRTLFPSLTSPWIFAVCFGTASISPGVAVPILASLIDAENTPSSKKLDETYTKGEKSRPESHAQMAKICLAALGVDVLVATLGFGLSISACFGHTHTRESHSFAALAAEEVLLGAVFGTVIGAVAPLLCNYLPLINIRIARKSKPDVYSAVHAFVLVLSISCMAYCKQQGMAGVGTMATFITWIIVAQTTTLPRDTERSAISLDVGADTASDMDAKQLAGAALHARLSMLWKYFMPFLFPIIGTLVLLLPVAATSHADAVLPHFVLRCVGVVVLGTAAKSLAALVCGTLIGFSVREAWYTAGLWAAKASTQATLCTVALEMAIHHQANSSPLEELAAAVDVDRAHIVFALMVAAIFIGLPWASLWTRVYSLQYEN